MKNILRLIVLTLTSLVMFTSNGNAQTVLIDPAGAGGFELGADMASNGWTAVNAATDGWFVGNAPVVATGNNCGFISSTGGLGWAYSQLSVFNHMYRDITIPANESKVTLSFKWKALGEGTAANDWDNMKVFLAPTTTVPTSTAAVTGATQLSGPGAVSGMYKLNSAAWNNETITFSGVPGTTYRLLFQWKSDGFDIFNPPAALDDISVVTSLPGIFISIITGNWNDPLTWDANAVPSGADNAIVSATHTVTVNAVGQAINNLIVNGTLAYLATPTQFNVNGNLTVNNGGLVNAFNGTTGKTLFVTGNIVNDGTMNLSVGAQAAGILNLNGTSPQTVSGAGSFTSNIIRNLTCSNTSTATPNIIWQFDNIVIQHNLNLTGARFDLGTRTLSQGSAVNTTTGSMTLTTSVGCGFMPGAKYRRWYTTAATGTTISAGFDPTATTSRFPFVNAAGTSQRWVHINRSSATTTGNTAGYLAIVYSDATTMSTGLSVVDGAYTITDRYNGNWTVTAEGGYVYASGFHRLAISANGAYPPLNGNTRIMLANAPMGGNHQNGTVTPTGQRIDLSTAQLTAGTLYLGIASADNQYPCAGTPLIPEALASTSASVCPNGTVTMAATGLTTGFIGVTNQWQVSTVDGGPYTNVVGGSGATTATHITAAIPTPGTYYYVLASTCTNSSITSISNQVIVTVNALPTISIAASNSGNFCGVGNLTATGASTYSWSPASSLLSNTGSTVTSIATSNTTFTATGTDANGCVNTATAAITYTAPPAIAITASTASFCGTGGTSTLTAASAGAYSYAWTALDGATLSAASGNSTDATVTQTSSVRVTGTESSSGCVEIQNYSIGVYPLPSATVTTTANGVCPGTSATINSGLSAGNFSSQVIAHAPITAPGYATTLVTGGVGTPAPQGSFGVSYDDGGWANIPIGFSFNFFGTPYSTINAGTNGNVMFGAFNANSLADFTFTTLPSTTEPFNMVALLAMDNDLAGSTGGTVKYWTDGYAPNRRFIISYEAVKEYGDAKFSTVQGVFYETTGIIEVHVSSSTNVDRNKVVGVNSGDGTIGVLAFASGTTATATNPIANPFAYRFTPPSNYTTTWFANGTQFDTGTNIFSESVTPAVTTTYSISYTNQTTGCTNAAGSAQVTMQVLGTVAPSNVVVQADVVNACSGVSFNLSTNYTGLTDGLTYQWQSSPDGTSWTDITGATALTYSTSLTAATSYRIGISSCGGLIVYSAPVSIGLAPPTQCYCIPTATYGCADGDVIARVILNTLDNNSGTGCPSDPDPTDPSFNANVQGPGYSDYTTNSSITTTLLPSTTYNCTVFAGQYSEHYTAWIDYNDDGTFDATERIGYTTTSVTGSGIADSLGNSASFPISIACNPPAGVHRMRVRCVFGQSSGLNILPCGNVTYGETEDYLITIAPAPTCPAPGLMTVATTTTTSADLSWSMGCSAATNFDFEYGPAGFVQGTGTSVSNQLVTVSGTTGSFTLNGLTPNTPYSVYYRANCGGGDVSPWSVASNFTTLCAPITLNTVNPGVACDSYALVALSEATPSNNAGLAIAYYGSTGGTGGSVTGPITSTQTVYAYAFAGSCSTEQAVAITIYNTPQLTTISPTICLGDSSVLWATQGTAIDFVYTLNGTFIGSGVGYYVSPSTTTTYGISAVGVGGCISAEQLATVAVNQPTTSNTPFTACNSYTWNGQTYTQSGTYTYTTSNALGCDSIATLNLTINNSTTSSSTVTACDTYSWNAQTYTQSGTYTYLTTNAAGCDSTATLNLTINNSTTSSTPVIACVSYQWNGQTYTLSGSYTYVTPNAVGCDSTATLNLTINNALFTTENVSACITYDWNGQTYTQSGTYTYLTTSINGCDSTVTLNLTINQPNTSTTTQTACDSYTWNGQTYTQSGTYVFNTTTVAGCDSTATLNLTVNASSTSTSTATACGTYSWNGQTYTQSGAYTYTTQNAAGCDSVATLNLTINAIPNATATNNGDGTATASAGSTYQWIDCATNTAIAGATTQTYAPVLTGSYSVIVTNASGCADTSSCITIEVIGLDETKESLVQVQPNPSTGLFNILFGENANGTVVITDATGRIIGTEVVNGSNKAIDLTTAVTGIYYFTIQTDNIEKVIKVIKN
jgi:hypothetical protein